MLFQSWLFLLFFVIFYAVYLAVKRTRFNNLWILIASYFFYGCWQPWFLILIAYSTCIDYIAVARMEKSSRKKAWLSFSIINSLALLGLFKYGHFAVENINQLLSSLGMSLKFAEPDIFLPIGLSFYIFKSIGYVTDCYRGEVAREKNFVRHAVFVSFFPILLAGPIERARNLLPQLRRPAAISARDAADGFSLFIVGLFKKLALADLLAVYVNKIYGQPAHYQSAALVLATFAFGWQLYFDFSGYSDMARGIARMMGFRIMLNFNNPYLADGLGDFWRRWHISLSTWFRDYLYIPLGGNRKGRFNTYKNVFITMVIMGFWHGAAWTYVCWGAIHAAGRCLTRDLEASSFYKDNVPKFVKQLFIFIFVTFAWIFFRAESLGDASLIITRIFSSGLTDPAFPLLLIAMIFLVWLYQFLYESRFRQLLEFSPVRLCSFVFMILYLIIFVSPAGESFIYFEF